MIPRVQLIFVRDEGVGGSNPLTPTISAFRYGAFLMTVLAMRLGVNTMSPRTSPSAVR